MLYSLNLSFYSKPVYKLIFINILNLMSPSHIVPSTCSSPCPCPGLGPSHMITTLPPSYKQQNMKSSVDTINIYNSYEYLVYYS